VACDAIASRDPSLEVVEGEGVDHAEMVDDGDELLSERKR
jgi:hypothetical protein